MLRHCVEGSALRGGRGSARAVDWNRTPPQEGGYGSPGGSPSSACDPNAGLRFAWRARLRPSRELEPDNAAGRRLRLAGASPSKCTATDTARREARPPVLAIRMLGEAPPEPWISSSLLAWSPGQRAGMALLLRNPSVSREGFRSAGASPSSGTRLRGRLGGGGLVVTRPKARFTTTVLRNGNLGFPEWIHRDRNFSSPERTVTDRLKGLNFSAPDPITPAPAGNSRRWRIKL